MTPADESLADIAGEMESLKHCIAYLMAAHAHTKHEDPEAFVRAFFADARSIAANRDQRLPDAEAPVSAVAARAMQRAHLGYSQMEEVVLRLLSGGTRRDPRM